MIDAQNDPVEQGTVQRFGHGVPCCDGLGEHMGETGHFETLLTAPSEKGKGKNATLP